MWSNKTIDTTSYVTLFSIFLQLRSKYAAYLQKKGCIDQFMSVIFRLMPEIPFNKDKTNIFEKAFCLYASGEIIVCQTMN